jgi:hypothetical protein
LSTLKTALQRFKSRCTIILSVCLLLVVSRGISQKPHTFYHKYEETASDYRIIQWNIGDTSGEDYLLKETVDNKGRVIKLEFLYKGQPASSLCYLANKVTFEYASHRVIESLFLSEELMYATDCEMQYKSIYEMGKENFLIRVHQFSRYDSSNLRGSTIQQWKKWVPEHLILNQHGRQLEIEYYRYSYAKLNGVYPVSKNFKIDNQYFSDHEAERQLIVAGIRKLRNIRR